LRKGRSSSSRRPRRWSAAFERIWHI
jgi:hypothetical protein